MGIGWRKSLFLALGTGFREGSLRNATRQLVRLLASLPFSDPHGPCNEQQLKQSIDKSLVAQAAKLSDSFKIDSKLERRSPLRSNSGQSCRLDGDSVRQAHW